jgi:hypothetical protein
MHATKINRFDGCLVALGYCLVVPAMLGLIGILVITGAAMHAPVSKGDDPTAVAMVGTGMLVASFLIALPFLIVGCILTLKKKVWRCRACGFVFERS